ncbi:MAG TPA: sulfatase [Actinomycetota bacterium]|nr:sulfatase [Actinomycetota bacterium]
MNVARRGIATSVTLLILLGAAAACEQRPPADAAVEPPPPRPNVLVIVTDDQRAPGTLDVMRHTRRFFSDGTRFEQAYATTPLCCPSRASIMTGLYAHNHGVKTNDDGSDLDQSLTLQRHLKDAGYRTALAGKYLNRWDPQVDPPHFDRWALWLRGWYYGSRYNVDGVPKRIDRYSTTYIVTKALGMMRDFEATDETPWFLYVWPLTPHKPFTPAPQDRDARIPPFVHDPATRDRDLSDEPDFLRASTSSESVARKTRSEQLRSLISLDRELARVYGRLGALGELENTLVVFMSDNGYLWGEHGIVGKRYPYTPSIQIPLLLRWPGYTTTATDSRLVTNLDVATTIAEATGLELATDGRSLISAGARDRLLIEQWADDETLVPTMASLLTPDFQYVEYFTPEGTVAERAYYDLQADPYQLSNLLGDADGSNDPPTAELSEQLDRDRVCSSQACP